ncbi:MAG: HAMP domain-containing histidine kinase [Pseudomonadales bacterium]|nr:HAMP domain-containing histidine kinase [Pseudomonadales bacterium]
MNRDKFDSSDGLDGRHSEASGYDEIYFRKQWLFSLVVLGSLFIVAALSAAIAVMQDVVIRQVINFSVAIVVLVCIFVSYHRPKKAAWSAFVAVVFLHMIGTSGFISNGGISTYAASLLPVIPITTALLLGKWASVISLSYILLLGLVSGGLTIYGKHPPNMTILEHQPAFAMYLIGVATISGFIATYSLITTTQLLNDDVREYASKLEEEALARQQAEEKAAEASLAKSQFLATISHELRTPLNSIIGFTQQLNKVELTERGRGCTNQITVSSKDLLKKVNDLLEYTETIFTKASINMAPCVIEDLFLSLRGLYVDVKNNNTINFDCLSLQNKVVVTDAEKVKKSLINIINNALEYTQNGEVIVTSEIQSVNHSPVLICSVKDTGGGIDETKIEYLFDVFTQSDMSLSRSHEGVGLGLASSHSLITLLGGTLSAKNNQEDGCTFYLKIPVALNQ